MASKSKKRRRVFRASCILAALIIAGSSFAWFTSKDEVTNRLSANAGYDVSIVESFAPPENWLPGQKVNKDVYAVNTGNVDAFVEETVSGRLTITQEEATTALTTESIKLNKAERYVVEAGAFLAYKPENSNAELGKQVVSMVPNATAPDAYEALNEPLTDFTPDAPGLYVFRRSIGVDPFTRVEQYTYDGYYYTGGVDETIQQQQVVGAEGSGHEGQYKWWKISDTDGSKTEEWVTGTGDPTPAEGYTFERAMENVPQQQVVGSVGTKNAGKYKWIKTETATGEKTVYWSDDATAPTEEGFTFEPVMADVIAQAGVPGGFYKISNLKVEYPGITLAGDTNQTDGYIINPTYGFYEDKTKVVDPVDLKYEPAVTEGDNQHPQRLVATYYTGKTVVYDGEGGLKALAKAYDDASIAYEDAVEEYKAAIRDQAASNTALTAKYKALQEKLDALQKAQNAEDKAYEELLKAIAKAKADAGALGDPTDDSSKDTAYGRYKKAQEELTAAQQAVNDADLADRRAQDAVNDKLEGIYGNADGGEGLLIGSDDGEGGTVSATDGNYTGGSLYGLYKAAEAAKNAETQDARDAFVAFFNAYVAANNIVVDGTTTPVTLSTVTYEQLSAMQFEANSTEPYVYDYWRKLVNFKEAEKNLNDAKDELADAQAEKRTTARNLAKKQAELGALDDDKTKDTAYGRLAKAQDDLDNAIAAANASGSGTGGSLGAKDSNDNTTAYGRYNNAKTARETAEDEFNGARTQYTEAANAAGIDSEQVDEAEENLLTATQNLANARMDYENAAPNSENDGLLKININLSDKVTVDAPTSNDQWQLTPDNVDKTAYFYYTGILGAGETSSKLIDSVELDSSVTEDMFKYFDFDLNVALKSAQIAIADDGATILTTAADNTLDADATLKTPTSVDTIVEWDGNEAPATANSYTAKATHSSATATIIDVTIEKLTAPVKIGTTNYNYKITTEDSKTYFGNSLTSGANFINGVSGESGYTDGTSTNGSITLTANATPVGAP